jgi:hypothetical protein
MFGYGPSGQTKRKVSEKSKTSITGEVIFGDNYEAPASAAIPVSPSDSSSSKMSNTYVIFLPPKTTSWVQPLRLRLDQGIIRAFKAIYRKFHIRWISSMLDSAVVDTASKARPTVRNAIEWAMTAWEDLSLSTVRNYWNHAKILPLPVTSGPVDAAVDELRALLIEFADSSFDVENLVNHASEQWTEEPQSDDEDAIAAYEARDATDEEEADQSEEVLPMTLRQAREAGQALKTFVQENQGLERMRPYLKGIEALVREMESMTVSPRTQ